MPQILPVSELSDESLVAEVVQGSVDSFEVLVIRYESKLLTFLSMKTGNKQDAEELVQNSFIKMYRKIKTFKLDRRFSTWLYTIAYNELISHIRKNRLESVPLDFELEDTSTSTRSIWNDLKVLLSSKDYLLLWLHYGEGYSVTEVGEIIGKRESAVKTALHRLRQKLPVLLEVDGNTKP